MIEFKTGDIFGSNVEALVNTVNCVGVMGAGIALQFKKRFYKNFEAYRDACKENKVNLGKMFVFDNGEGFNPRYIINFPTKRHWKNPSRMEDIDEGLKDLVVVISKYNIKSISVPALGSGLGGLDWDIVKRKINGMLSGLDDCVIEVFEPIVNKKKVKESGLSKS